MFKLLRRYKRGDVSTTDVVGHLETVIVKAGKQQVLARDCVILALNPIAFYAQKQLTHMKSQKMQLSPPQRLWWRVFETFTITTSAYSIYDILPIEIFSNQTELNLPLL